MKKKNSTYFIDDSLTDYDYLVLDNLGNLNEEHDKTFKEDEKVSDSVYFHGSVEDIGGYLNKPINWITKDFDYAKTFALDNGYVYECSANLGNLLYVGKTDARVFDMIPSTPLKFSREFTAIIRKLNVSEDSIRRIIDNVADEYKVNPYRLAIRPVARSMAFKRILEGLGFDGIRAIEYDNINNKDVETFGLFDKVKVLDKANEELIEKLVKSRNGNDVYITTSPYEVKNYIFNQKTSTTRIVWIRSEEDANAYGYGNGYNLIHGDIEEVMLDYFYFPDEEDVYEGEMFYDVSLIFIPNDCEGEKLGDEKSCFIRPQGYFIEYDFAEGRLLCDSFDFEKSSLYSVLSSDIIDKKVDESLHEDLQEVDNEENALSSEQVSFFKGSKIRDEQGRLIVCYHGDDNDFDEFKKEFIGSKSLKYALPNVGIFGEGFYFTNDESLAKKYGKVQQYYLNIRNPFIFKDYNSIEKIKDLRRDTGINFGLHYDDFFDEYRATAIDSVEDQKKFTQFLKEKGYDGIIYSYLENFDKVFEVVAFEPNQIKSITNKTPTSSSNINELLDESEDNKSLEDKFYRWQVGGEDFNNIFSEEDVKYMRSHLTTITTPIYRCEMLSDNNNRNLDVGDTITFDRLRSFSKSKEGFYDVMFMWDDAVESEDDDVICFKTKGPVKVFDVESEFNLDYSKAFDDFGDSLNTQAEIFVEGTFKVVKKGTIYDDYLETKHVLLTLEQVDSNFEESLNEGKFSNNSKGSCYIASDGRFYNLEAYETHDDVDYEDLPIANEGDQTIMFNDTRTEQDMYPYCYIELKPTEAQYNSLVYAIDNLPRSKKTFEVNLKNKKIKEYDLTKVISDDIIKDIREYFNKNNSLDEEKAITWGDLDYAQKTDTRRMMSGRGTGHFGTGFYFVGKEGPYGLDKDNNIKGYDYEPSRPIYEIDLDKYNLYKPKDNDSAYRLHDAMASINNYYSPDMNKFLFSNTDVDELIDSFYSAVSGTLSFDEDVDDDDFDMDELDAIFSSKDDDSYEDDLDDEEPQEEKGADKYLEKAKEWIENNGLTDWINTGYDDLDTWLDKNKNKLGLIEDCVEDAINNRDKYIGYVEYAIDVLCKAFNTDRNTLMAMCKAFYNMKSEDSISTLLFKEFGYEGVDVTHLNHDAQGLSGLDNFGYGTVVYDLKPGTFKKIVEPRENGSIHSKSGSGKSKASEDLDEDVQDNVLDALDKEFGQEEVYMWSTYILPNGHFLNPDNSKYWDEINEDPQYEHCDFEDWAWSHGYKGELQMIYDNCIKMNVTSPYLGMPDKARPTSEQLKAVKEILKNQSGFYFEQPEWDNMQDEVEKMGPRVLGVFTPMGDKAFDLDVSDADDIIRAINQAYIRGSFLGEELDEDLQETDNEGNVLSKEQIKFFENSQVRDKENNLLVCIHYTNNDFDTFDINNSGDNWEGWSDFDSGLYFVSGNDEYWNKMWSKDKANKKLCYLNITNPFDLTKLNERGLLTNSALDNEIDYIIDNYDTDRVYYTKSNDWYKKYPNRFFEILQKMRDENGYDLYIDKILKKCGYDGVIAYNQIVAFEPNQIKKIDNLNPTSSSNINESIGFPITVYTYQKPQVRELLERGETYIADYSRSMFSNHEDDKDYKHPYKELVRILGLHNCPIFGALSKHDLYTMLNASGIDWNESDIIRLEIPKDELKYTEYYDWTDYIYALEEPEQFEEESGLSLEDLENLLRTQKGSLEYDLCQVVFDKIEPQWYEDGLDEESIENSEYPEDEEDLDEYFDSIEDSGESYGGKYATVNDCPIYVTDETYKVKALIEKGDKPYRILLLDSCNYLVQDARGNKTHWDMYRKARELGYIELGDDYNDESYMVFIPTNFNGQLRWHTRLGTDAYDSCRVYSFGVMFVRDSVAYDNNLFQALGEPEREVNYDTFEKKVTIVKGDTKKVVDVGDLNGEPNNAITQQVEESLSSDFESKLYDFIAGGWFIEDIFDEEDIEYMNNHLTTCKDIYRLEINNVKDYKIGDKVEFSNYRSFTKNYETLQKLIRDSSDFLTPGKDACEIFNIKDDVKCFDISEYNKEQKEVLVKGTFKVIDIKYVKIEDTNVPIYVLSK